VIQRGGRLGTPVEPFVYEALAGRVVFGAGRLAEVGDEVHALGVGRVFLIHDQNAKAEGDAIADQLSWADVCLWGEAIQHVPLELAERARAAVDEHGSDAVVCVGGGSEVETRANRNSEPVRALGRVSAGASSTSIICSTSGACARMTWLAAHTH
jgi:maleylacetate reductase